MTIAISLFQTLWVVEGVAHKCKGKEGEHVDDHKRKQRQPPELAARGRDGLKGHSRDSSSQDRHEMSCDV